MARVVITRRSGKANDAAYARFVNDPDGPIRHELRRRATNVQQFQIRRAPRRTGKLVSTSRKREGSLSPLRPTVEVLIGRDGFTDYLGYILFGTPAHVIRAIPNRPNAHLRFIAGGNIVFARQVNHPGNRANNFVRASIAAAYR